MFSTFDTISDYWSIESDDEDIDKIAFLTNYRLIKYTWITIGSTIAPAMFKRATDVIVAPMRLQHAFESIDETIIYLKSMK